MTRAALSEELGLAMDGIVLTLPPPDPVERHNYLTHGDTHMWRRQGEAAKPSLSGDDDFAHQVCSDRLVPLWGGVSEGGCAIVTFHENRKITTEEWVAAVNSGKLRNALCALWPTRPTGPWQILCDNERFLRASASRAAYGRHNVTLWDIPKWSPDLNPVEKFWGWLRKQLRRLDLADMKAKRPVLTVPQYRSRVRGVMRTQKAQQVARSCTQGLRKVCREVVRKNGARTRG